MRKGKNKHRFLLLMDFVSILNKEVSLILHKASASQQGTGTVCAKGFLHNRNLIYCKISFLIVCSKMENQEFWKTKNLNMKI